jgi:hypothetical protein
MKCARCVQHRYSDNLDKSSIFTAHYASNHGTCRKRARAIAAVRLNDVAMCTFSIITWCAWMTWYIINYLNKQDFTIPK